MKDRFDRGPHNIFFEYQKGMCFLTCWFTSGSRRLSVKGAVNSFWNVCDSLAERRLREAKKADSARIINGHAEVVVRCLEVLLTDSGE